jgi:cation:H+ antiporter
MLKKRIYFSKKINDIKNDFMLFKKTWHNVVLFLTGIALVLASSAMLVWSGKNLAQMMSINAFIFGILFVSLGTALPELVFGIKSAFLKHRSMVIGNTMGSIAFNAGFVIGAVSIISPIKVQINFQFITAVFFIFLAFLLFNLFVRSKTIISKKEGVVLLLVYILFVFIEYFMI